MLSAIGAGGMGEVWRAKDTRLDREVAIKVLPAAFAENAQFLARFEREAKSISSLNHPHICTLHDVGHENGLRYLVMELIEGESLADRLQRGPLPLEQVLRYGAQIATALDAAHRQGVIHRDLKPGNVMITKTGAKLLDFGLAKSNGGQALLPVQSAAASATQHKPITEQGTILGTFQYMSPEALEGVEVDARSDIFALGAVLYEMATARRAFQGATKTSLIAAIVSSQPAPISSIAPMTPPALDHVVRKCLEKDPDERWQSAHDIASELRWISEAGSQAGVPASSIATRRSRKNFLMVLAVTGWVAAIAAAAWMTHERSVSERARRLFGSDLVFPANASIGIINNGPIVLSPDGRRLAYVRRDSGLAVKDFETGKLQLLDETGESSYPFWSPDGRWLGFFSDGKLKKIEFSSGAVQVICAARDGRGGSWSRNGTILFAPDIYGPLMKVPEEGGSPVAVTRVPDGRYTHRNPHFLPDGETFLFTSRESRSEALGTIAMGSLDGDSHKILVPGSNPQYADGYLFFVREHNLFAQRLLTGKGVVSGPTRPIAQRVEYFNPRDVGNFAVGKNTLVYRQTIAAPTQLTWLTRKGGTVSVVGDPGLYASARTNGTSGIATLLRRDDAGQESVWVMDLKRGTVTRSTENYRTGVTRAIPAASGQQIAVSSTWTTRSGLWIQAPSATGATRMLRESVLLEDWSRDGKVIVGNLQEAGTGFDIVWLSVDDPKKLHVFAGSRFNEQTARLSPNGRWLAFMSDDGGSRETYISDFPAGKNRWQVTRSGGQPLLWTSDGRELIVGVRGQRAVYPITEAGHSIDIGPPKPLPNLTDAIGLVGTEGERLLVLKRVAEAADEPLRVIRNWERLLEK